jgi:hypothetical protein
MNRVMSKHTRAAKSRHALRTDRIVLAVFGFCVCVSSVSFGQTTQPRPKDPKQEQEPPKDSPEPLANARRPYQALFGGANTGPRRQTALSFSGSVSEVYDRDEVDDGEPQLGGLYTNFTGDLDYGRYGSRVQIAATGGADLRYYSQLTEFLAADYHAGAGMGAHVAPHTRILISEAVAYSPVGLPGLFANPLPPELGDPLPPDSRFAVTDDKVVTAVTTASVEHRFSIRSQLGGSGSYRYNNYLAENTPTSDWSTLDSGVAYRYRVTETRSLRMGYNYRRASYSLPEAPGGRGPRPSEHNFFIGVAADRAFSDEQRTTVSFEGGMSAFSAPNSTDLLQASDRWRFVFDAVVAHQIGESWLLLGSFDRGSQFNQGYGGPVFADALYVSATGFLNARADLTASLAHTEGENILTLAGRPFTTTAAGARFRYALSRNWALTAEYFRYSYDFTSSPGFPTLIGVPERFKRNSLRGGVSMFLPIIPR